MDEKTITFEEAMEKLEAIVESLEEGDVPLEKAIDKYKEGMELAKICSKKLKSAEEQMVKVIKETGEMETFVIQEEE
ncbi:exodeoxyribonuclease VII small subunit [Fervidibacillus halotolerans]|uniref:Exodeoxyribonuclease 7 small subunit n=1 Tax=Fervidibacillus halotolerans TaxID=2980027 RepID=A0A9E8LXK6_9BACI|nr:exodeoxyribonuclease VII small subunit [Fervidibacillus halotolerans]WAA11419.1 exodeoxyribonuclease VII small subunit [Fervidibacillus halotolerans]